MKRFFIYVLLVFCMGCPKKQETALIGNQDKSEFNKSVNFKVLETIKPENIKEVEDWKELQTLQLFMERFQKTTPREVLSNALELKGITKSLKDSVNPSIFNTSSFKARINILHNEVLRLADMTSIQAIQSKEVELQTKKIVTAYAGINSKINAVLAKKRFEDAIDIDVKFIGLDSTKIDSVTKKSIKKTLLKKEIPIK